MTSTNYTLTIDHVNGDNASDTPSMATNTTVTTTDPQELVRLLQLAGMGGEMTSEPASELNSEPKSSCGCGGTDVDAVADENPVVQDVEVVAKEEKSLGRETYDYGHREFDHEGDDTVGQVDAMDYKSKADLEIRLHGKGDNALANRLAEEYEKFLKETE